MTTSALWDLVVVGAGPCGLAVGVAAKEHGLRCVLLDKGTVADAIYRYPTYTVFFSGADKLEIGGLPFTIAGDKPTRREALRYYRKVVQYFDLDVRQYERVERIEAEPEGFRIAVQARNGARRAYRARAVVVATGYFDTPNRLDVPGEDLPHVLHYFVDPFPFFRQRVVVIGGGNSAADAALSSWREGAEVTMVHLGASLDPGVKPWVRPDLENRIAEGSIRMLWEHRVVEICPDRIRACSLRSGDLVEVPCDWVLAMTGYTPDPSLLRGLGVRIDPATGVPEHDPETMETNVPGVFLAGVIAAGYDANRIFIENGRFHGPRIAAALAQRWAARGA